MEDEVYAVLSAIVGADYASRDVADRAFYSRDCTEVRTGYCDAVLKPATAGQISEILKVCRRYHLPVVARGGGTGVTGGALPARGGVILSMERMNRILDVNPLNRQAVVEAGVVVEHLQEALLQHGLFLPPVPGSAAACFIGGCIAMSAGGPKSAKYGTIREYIVNLEVVLPDGGIIWTGSNVTKSASGFNLTQLFVGSEGTLGVITRAVIKAIPHPEHEYLLLAPFSDVAGCITCVNHMVSSGLTPASVEFLGDYAFEIATREEGRTLLPANATACLLIEFDGHDMLSVEREVEAVNAVLERHCCGEILIADSSARKERIRKLRRSVVNFLNSNNLAYRDIDICVARSMQGAYLEKVREICTGYGMQHVCFGHVMDGNLHVMILLDRNKNEEKGIAEIYDAGMLLGGTISGEHGIGLLQKDLFSKHAEKQNIALMKGIKKLFDPGNILNPGKIFNDLM